MVMPALLAVLAASAPALDRSYPERRAALAAGRDVAPLCSAEPPRTLADAALSYRAAVRQADYPEAALCIREAQRLATEGQVSDDAILSDDLDVMTRLLASLENRPRTILAASDEPPDKTDRDCDEERPGSGGVRWAIGLPDEPCFRLLVGTGATMTILTPDAARTLGARDEREGFAVVPELPITTLDDPLVLRNVLVSILDGPRTENLVAMGYDGVIGLHALAAGVVYREGSPLPIPLFVRHGDAPLPDPREAVRMTITYDAKALWMPLDDTQPDTASCRVNTGASRSVLPTGAITSADRIEPSGTSVRGIDRQATYDRAKAVTFTLQGQPIRLAQANLSHDGTCVIGLDVLYTHLAYLDLRNAALWFRRDVEGATGFEAMADVLLRGQKTSP